MTAFVVGAGMLALGSAGYSYSDKLKGVAPWLVEFAPFLSSQIDVGSFTEAAANYLPKWLSSSSIA